MAGILHALASAAVREVTIGGTDWRLRRVSSADLVRAHACALLLLPADPTTPPDTAPGGKGAQKASQTPRDALLHTSPDAMVAAVEMQDAMACASVTHARAPGGEWDPIELVLSRAREDHEAGRMWIGDLGMPIRSEIAQEAMRHSTEDGEAVERLASFRGTA